MDSLKKELFMTPQLQFGIKMGADTSSFPVWRENDNKLYIPRFYGVSRYGLPERYELDAGESINIRFMKSLRDYQEKIIKIYLDYVSKTLDGSGAPAGGGGAILEVPCGRGKTVMALKIIAELSKKTLILVHKEFLMNQWIERIEEFLPSARVGKIQGSTFEVEGKDIVIGMIQTMYSRDFPANTFSPFGLTIVDEVHRIGSEEFSKTLLKTITPYMLGISATVERKDGLTRILNMFIGEKIYSEERNSEDSVCVRGIEYISSDPEFNENEVDWKGDPKFSTMISKICDFGPRSDVIVRV
jgi:superfamily II DNA or RNA helicase